MMEREFSKATGFDGPIRSAADPKRLIGLKKTLIYYQGWAPCGSMIDWVMNEYRLPNPTTPPKVYRKATSLKELEQRAEMESPSPRLMMDSVLSLNQESWQKWMAVDDDEGMKKQAKEGKEEEVENDAHEVEILTKRSVTLPKLKVLKHNGLEWMQDPFLTQLRSPWMDLLSPFYASVLNS